MSKPMEYIWPGVIVAQAIHTATKGRSGLATGNPSIEVFRRDLNFRVADHPLDPPRQISISAADWSWILQKRADALFSSLPASSPVRLFGD